MKIKKRFKVNNVHQFMKKHKFGYTKIKKRGVKDNRDYKKLKYFNFEKKIIKLIDKNQLSLIVKSRQMHFSTLMAAYTFWGLAKRKDVYYISNSRHLNELFVEKVRDMINKNKNSSLTINNKRNLSLNNGGSLMTYSFNPEMFYSRDIKNSIIIIDEAAFIDGLDVILDTIFGRYCPKTTQVIIGSTPNGYEYFYELYKDSFNSSSQLKSPKFKSIKVNFQDNPLQDEEFINHIYKSMNKSWMSFRQEILGDFFNYRECE